MLSMSKLHKRKHERTKSSQPPLPDVPTSPTDVEPVALTLHTLPKRVRGRVGRKPPEPPTDKKILSISDLPRRTKASRRAMQNMRQRVAGAEGIFDGQNPRDWARPRRFSEYVKNGTWKGRRCFIIGGGPSVKDVDVSLLKGELTIGINRAYELLDPSILFGVDGQMWGWVEQGKCGEESKKKFNAYTGYKVWMALHDLFPPDFHLIDVDNRGGYRIGTTGCLAFKGNSGYGAINLAAALGANPIYLLGFDMEGDGEGKQVWWHDGYPTDYGENVYARYIEEISRFAPVLKEAGFKVVNLNPKSKLRCFKFGDYEKVVKNKPIIPETAIEVMEKPCRITAITPTGDRPLAFTLCRHWMEQQTVKPDQWIVVDDGKVPLKPSTGMQYIRRNPSPRDPAHTLNLNIAAAIPHIRGDKILIIEDDEYYAPQYVETMSRKLEDHEMAGIIKAKYYHLPTGGYYQIANTLHASFAQTGFRRTILPKLTELIKDKNATLLDMKLWTYSLSHGKAYLFNDHSRSLYMGVKGMPGRAGIGVGHDVSSYNAFDKKRSLLKKWVPDDYQIYLDILAGKLTTENCAEYFSCVTGISVCYNTKELMQRAYESVRKFHPNMPIIIIDGSDPKNPCAKYVRSLRSRLTTVVQPGYNIGHGDGMCLGISMVNTPYALIFDSDIEMLKSPVAAMVSMMEPDTYGVGYTEKTGLDGYEYGAHPHHKGQESMRMLHPYFHLLSIANYHKFHPYVHHGAPCYLAARDIHERGLSDKIIKDFPGLGHSSGKGWVWTGEPREFIRHDPAGTRDTRRTNGQPEIEPDWVRK